VTEFAPTDAIAFAEPSLLLHAFAPTTAPPQQVEASRDRLETLWDACERLGMQDPRRGEVGMAFAWPAASSTDRFTILAARGTLADDARRQAVLFARHDVVGLAIALEDPVASKDLKGWRELWELWGTVRPERSAGESLLGECLSFLGEYDAPTTPVEALGAAVRHSMQGTGLVVWDAPSTEEAGTVLWDGEDADAGRIVAVLAPAGQGDALSRRFWWSGDHELAPMGRYQLHAAKLGYESRVYAIRKPMLDAAVTRVETAVNDLLEQPEDTARGGPTPASGAEDRLIGAQAGSAGLVIEVSYLRELQRTVEIAKRNMAALVPDPVLSGPDTMFTRDQAVATRLSEQIANDVGYADAVSERGQHAVALTAVRLQHRQERLQRERTRLILFQTAFLGALLTGLGAIATFNLTLDVPQALRLPLLATLVALLIAAPIVAGNWHDGYRRSDRVVIGLLGAAVGWFGISLALRPAPWFAAVPAAAAGAAISQVLARRRAWRDATTG
jgi:hypothetical protein